MFSEFISCYLSMIAPFETATDESNGTFVNIGHLIKSSYFSE